MANPEAKVCTESNVNLHWTLSTSPRQAQQVVSWVKNLRKKIQRFVRVRKNVRQYARKNVRQNVRRYVWKNVRKNVRRFVRKNVRKSVRRDVRQNVRRYSEDMSERISERMSERMSEEMSERMSQDMSERMSDKMLEDMSERVSQDMSDRMSEDMSERMPDRMSGDMGSKLILYSPGSLKKVIQFALPHSLKLGGQCQLVVKYYPWFTIGFIIIGAWLNRGYQPDLK